MIRTLASVLGGGVGTPPFTFPASPPDGVHKRRLLCTAFARRRIGVGGDDRRGFAVPAVDLGEQLAGGAELVGSGGGGLLVALVVRARRRRARANRIR